MRIPPKLLKIIKENRKFLIVGHINPDGDSVGSCVALALGLKKLGKSVYVLGKDPVPEIFRFLPRSELIKNKLPSADFDVLFLLDCNSFERTGFSASGGSARGGKGLTAKSVVVIDHHMTAVKSKCRINMIYPDASATGELVHAILKKLSVSIDKKIATNLYTAIFTDTGGFKYSNTSVRTLRIAADLIEAGVNTWKVSQEVYESIPVNRFRLLTLTLSALEIKGKISCITVTQNMFRKTKTTAEDTEHFVEHARVIKGVEVAILLRENGKNSYKISLRSKGKINVAHIADKFGGGGHANAAGCKMRGTYTQVKNKIIKSVKKAMG